MEDSSDDEGKFLIEIDIGPRTSLFAYLNIYR